MSTTRTSIACPGSTRVVTHLTLGKDNYDHWLYDQVFLAMKRGDDLVPSWRSGTATLSS
jgi:hypothetical protein